MSLSQYPNYFFFRKSRKHLYYIQKCSLCLVFMNAVRKLIDSNIVEYINFTEIFMNFKQLSQNKYSQLFNTAARLFLRELTISMQHALFLFFFLLD